MSSVHAARAIFTALAGVEGVSQADVGRGGAIVEHDGTVTEAALREAVALAGFEIIAVTEERRVLRVLG
jgi:copper chaperone CopZ